MKKSIVLILLFSQILFFTLLPIWIQLTDYLHPLVVGVVWFCFSFLILFVSSWITKEKIKITKHILHVITVFYAVLLLILLFFRPKGTSYGTINLIPFETICFYFSGQVDFLIALYNISANIGLFIPFGLYYIYVRKKPTLKEILIITISSITIIECLQFITKRGSLDIDDLILNFLGVYLGYFIQPFFNKVLIIRNMKSNE